MEQVAPVKKRDTAQDIVKAFCIFAVVICHAVHLPSEVEPYLIGIVGFVMPYFLLISGYNYHGLKGSYWSVILKRFKQLVLGLVIVCLAYGLIIGLYSYFVHQATFRAIGVSTLCSFLGVMPIEIGFEMSDMLFQLPSWFVWYMFFGCVIFYAIADWALKKTPRTISIIILGIVITMICYAFKLDQNTFVKMAISIPAVVSFFLFGSLLSKTKLLTGEGKKSLIIINSIFAVAILWVFGYFFPRCGTVIGGTFVLPNSPLGFLEVPFTFLTGFLFAYYLTNFARLIKKIPFVSKYLIFNGKSSLYIYFLHIGFVILFSDLLGIKTMGGFVTEFSWMSLLTFLLVMIACNVCVLLYNLIKKYIKLKNKKIETT